MTPRLTDRVVRALATEVARANGKHSLAMAERCLAMALHWGDRAQHYREQAFRWLEIAETGAPGVAVDVDEMTAAGARSVDRRVRVLEERQSGASPRRTCANDTERKSA